MQKAAGKRQQTFHQLGSKSETQNLGPCSCVCVCVPAWNDASLNEPRYDLSVSCERPQWLESGDRAQVCSCVMTQMTERCDFIPQRVHTGSVSARACTNNIQSISLNSPQTRLFFPYLTRDKWVNLDADIIKTGSGSGMFLLIHHLTFPQDSHSDLKSSQLSHPTWEASLEGRKIRFASYKS